MPEISEHFDDTEFVCKCGCGGLKIKKSLIERLEKLHTAMNAKSIVVNSGYRCPSHSVKVGGYANDSHTLGFAADVTVYKQDGNPYTVETVAFYADKTGFGGIGMMSGNSIHLDTRDVENYSNNFWRGDERTGGNFNVSDLKTENIQTVNTQKTYCVEIDGKTYYIGSSYPKSIIIKEVN